MRPTERSVSAIIRVKHMPRARINRGEDCERMSRSTRSCRKRGSITEIITTMMMSARRMALLTKNSFTFFREIFSSSFNLLERDACVRPYSAKPVPIMYRNIGK